MSIENNILIGPPPYYPLEEGTAGEQLHRAITRYAAVPGTLAYTDVHTELEVTYKEFLDVTCRLAEAMKNYGLGLQHTISVCSENCVQFFMPVCAALYIGVATAPTNDIYNERELYNSLSISQPTVVFTSRNSLQKILGVQSRLPVIKKIIMLDTKKDYLGYQSMQSFMKEHVPANFNVSAFKPLSFDLDRVACIMNSSGSTGLPKGVPISHRNTTYRFSHCRDPVFGNQIIPDTTILCAVPFHHAFGTFTNLGYIICGFHVVLMYRFNEHLFLQTLQDYKCQSALIVPTVLAFLAKNPLVDKYDLSHLHEIASGGAPLSKEISEIAAKRFKLPGIRQGYGLTETTCAIVITAEGEFKPGAVGKVVPFYSLKVLDLNTGKKLGPNERGEICFTGPMIMKGYINNPEATREIIDEEGWIHSGDIGYFDEDGHVYIVDRLKSLIKYKGYQVPPAELEALLLQHPFIEDAGVAGVPDEVAGDLPGAVVVLKEGKSITEKEIQDYVAGQVTSSKKLRGGVEFVKEVPKGFTGKIDTRKIKEILIKAQKGKSKSKAKL